jgi:hypothetical protein
MGCSTQRKKERFRYEEIAKLLSRGLTTESYNSILKCKGLGFRSWRSRSSPEVLPSHVTSIPFIRCWHATQTGKNEVILRIKLSEIVTVEGKRRGKVPARGFVHLANKSRNVGPEQSHDT